MARLNSSGTDDTSFTGDGHITLILGSLAAAVAVGIDSLDRPVVGASSLSVSFPSASVNASIIRFKATSALDASALDAGFSDDGLVELADESLLDLLVLPDDRILVATIPWLAQTPRIRRLEPDGDSDPTWGGGDGVVDLDLSAAGSWSGIFDLELDPRGRIVALGNFFEPDFDLVWAVARILPDGDLDESFGTGGVVAIGYDSDLTYVPEAIAVQSDGAVVVVGEEGSPGVVTRFDRDGVLDPTFFAPDGSRTITFEPSTDLSGANVVGVGGDGRILVAGFTSNENSIGDFNYGVARIESGVVFCDGFESQGLYGASRWSAVVP